MPTVRVLVVSDSHLSERAPEALANWEAVVAHVERERPDLVLHLGDVSLDGAHDQADLMLGRESLDRLAVPWRAIPGNHDLGDDPWGEGVTTVDDERLARWRAAFDGDDWWSLELGAWTVIALDAQLFGSELAAEGEQWAWLEETLAGEASGRPVLLALHKPLVAAPEELAAAPPYRFAFEPGRLRVRALIDARRVPLVLSGHVHQSRELGDGHQRHVWAPTTWAALPDRVQPVLGSKRCGVLSVSLADDGVAEVVLAEPEGLRHLVLHDDVPDPYGD